MSIHFTHPIYLWGFLTLLPMIFAHYKSLVEYSRTQKNFMLLFRMMVVTLLVMAMAGLTIARPSAKKKIVFLVDESRSVGASSEQVGDNYIRRVRGADKRIECETLYFSENVRKAGTNPLPRSNNGTNMEGALFSAISGCPHDVSSHIVLLSDGNETRGNTLNAAMHCGMPVSTVPFPASEHPEVQICGLSVPATVRKGEPFRVNVSVGANIETAGKLSLFRNGHRIETQTISLAADQKKFAFELNGDASNEMEIKATVEAEQDTMIENNSCSVSVLTEGNPAVLMIDKNPDSVREFVKAMSEQGIRVEVRSTDGLPKELSELTKFDALIFSDVSADVLTFGQMDTIRTYVEYSGGGFMMLGGANAFGLGGYDKTPLSDVLPVESRFEKEKEMPGLAICLVIDRSGSMEGEKLALTKDAAKGVVELLSAKDYISLIAFDTIPHKIVALQNVTTPSSIRQMIGTITSEGGTNIYGALNEACQELQRANAKFKHIILLTDGHSTPGDYDTTVRQIIDKNITVSTVGMGECDRFLLEKLAKDGQGRFYACNDPSAVPQIFARETTMADRSSLSEEPFFPVPEAVLPLLKNIPLENIPSLLGNVIVRPKKSSEIHLVTESGDPLLASWRYGLGIALAFTSDVNGRWSAEWLEWPEFARFWAQVLRFTMRKRSSENAELQLVSRDGMITASLEARNTFGEFLNDAAVALTVIDSSRTKTSLTMKRVAPGKYMTSFPGKKQEKYFLEAVLKNRAGETVHVGRTYLTEVNHELDINPVNRSLLKRIAMVSGGLFDPGPELLIRSAQFPPVWERISAGPLFLLLALLTFVLDVYLRRINLDHRNLDHSK